MTSPTDERDLFRWLLEAIAGGERSPFPEANAARLLEIARYHRLTPLLAARCAAELPRPIAEACRQDRLVTVARNMMLAQTAEDCLRALTAAGIATIVLKGLAYEATLYGDWGPGVRATGDVDLLVPDERRRDAFAVMDRLGFEPRAAAPGFDEADYHEVAWTRNSVEVDLHLALAPRARCHIDYGSVWSEAQEFTVGRTTARALASSHAAVFHALHMAIDHFNVPGVYLLDLSRLLPDEQACATAERTAQAWGCERPLATALALVGSFLTKWAPGPRHAAAAPRFAADVVRDFGPPRPVPRTVQLRRKLAHIDRSDDAVRYLLVQARRNVRELVERHFRKRSARERLMLPAR